MAFDKAKHGGKKGGKAAKGKKVEVQEPQHGPENCAVFIAHEYPDWQKTTFETIA